MAFAAIPKSRPRGTYDPCFDQFNGEVPREDILFERRKYIE